MSLTTTEQKAVQAFLQEIKDQNIQQKCESFLIKDINKYLICLNNLNFNSQKASQHLKTEIVNSLKELNSDILMKAENLSGLIEDKKTNKKLRDTFRALTGQWFYQSNYFKKSLDKPRGYPGDFEMMEIIYNYTITSEGIIGRYFDQCYLDSPYAQAVRNRKKKMVEILSDVFSKATDSDFRVLNIACGPCRELKELFSKPINLKSKLQVICFDHDQEALDYSKNAIIKWPKNVEMIFLKGDILSYVRNIEKSRSSLGEFDLVYSIGLADYLPDKLFKRMLEFGHHILKPQGNFIIAHKIEDNDPLAPITPKWICEWVFNKRNADDLMKLIEDSGIENYSLLEHSWDVSNHVIFITIAKY